MPLKTDLKDINETVTFTVRPDARLWMWLVTRTARSKKAYIDVDIEWDHDHLSAVKGTSKPYRSRKRDYRMFWDKQDFTGVRTFSVKLESRDGALTSTIRARAKMYGLERDLHGAEELERVPLLPD